MIGILIVSHLQSWRCWLFYNKVQFHPLQLDWLLSAHAQTNNLSTIWEGYKKSETTIRKLLQRRIYWRVVYFHYIIFGDVTCENMWKSGSTKIYNPPLDASCRGIFISGLRLISTPSVCWQIIFLQELSVYQFKTILNANLSYSY